jgi:hypothetical protein
MRNVTLAIEDSVLETVRKYAASQGTTVNALIREHLGRLASEHNKAARARKRLVELSRTSTAEVGPITWKREELYGR